MTTPQSTSALARVLRLEPNSHTCIGRTKTRGERCQRLIAYASRQAAEEILLDIVRLDPQSPRLDIRLEELASLHLCTNCNNRHQDQVAEIARQWAQDIRNEPRQQMNFESHLSSQQQETTNHQADIPPLVPLAVEPTTYTIAPSIETEQTTTTEDVRQEPTSPFPSTPTETRHLQRQDSHPAHCNCRAQCRQGFHPDRLDLWRASQEADERERIVCTGKLSLMRDIWVYLADVATVTRSGPTEMVVLLLLLCCGVNARVLLALVFWIATLVLRVAAVRVAVR